MISIERLYWSLQYLGLWNTWWCRWWFQNLRSRWPSLQFSLEKVCTVWNCEVNWKAIWGCWYWSCSPNNIFIVHKKSQLFGFASLPFPISCNLTLVSMLTLCRDEKCCGFNSDLPLPVSLTACHVLRTALICPAKRSHATCMPRMSTK